MKKSCEIKSILTKDEERELIKKAKLGDNQATSELIVRNNGLILKIANHYLRYYLQLDDLVNEGRLGVYKAILNFDLDKDYKFSTYAFWWIRSYISMFVKSETRNITISSEFDNELSHFKKKRGELINILNREPSSYELANYLEITYQELEKLLIFENDTTSLNYLRFNIDSSTELINLIKSEQLEVDEEVMSINLKDELEKILKQTRLTEKQINIILLRCLGKTLDEIGKIYGVGRECIRQNETSIKRILKKDDYILGLCDYYPEYRKYKKM